MQSPAAIPQTAPSASRSAPTATEMYEAARLTRRELRSQLNELQGERSALQHQMEGTKSPANLKGLEGRLTALDARIADVEKQLASADAMVANRAAVPGVVVERPPTNDDIPPSVMVVSGLGMLMVLLLPLSIAMARRAWRRGVPVAPALPDGFSERMANLERGMEAVAIEVERVGEGQRFVTQLLAESERQRQMQALSDLPAERRLENDPL